MSISRSDDGDQGGWGRQLGLLSPFSHVLRQPGAGLMLRRPGAVSLLRVVGSLVVI